MTINLIAAMDMNLGIGDSNGSLLFYLPKDLKHFKNVTTGKACIFGRKTFESLPTKPLPNRDNYILTMNESYTYDGATILHSIDEVLELAQTKEIFVCGGEEIYNQLINYADCIFATHIHAINLDADTFFPDFTFKNWKLVKSIKNEADSEHPVSFTFAEYIRKNKNIGVFE